MKSLAQRIKELRNEKKMTQTEFGQVFGVGKTTVSMWENSNSSPDDELKIRIAVYFNVTLDYLLGRLDHKYFSKDNTLAFNTTKDELSDEDMKMVKNLIARLKENHKK